MSLEELAASWQGQALAFSGKNAPQLCRVLMSVFADNYDETMIFLLNAAFPGFTGLVAPFLCSNPKIDKAGRIIADLIDRDGAKIKDYVVFADEEQMEGIFRRLADRLKLSDLDRIDLFVCLRHWVKADMRLD